MNFKAAKRDQCRAADAHAREQLEEVDEIQVDANAQDKLEDKDEIRQAIADPANAQDKLEDDDEIQADANHKISWRVEMVTIQLAR